MDRVGNPIRNWRHPQNYGEGEPSGPLGRLKHQRGIKMNSLFF